jgi:hypothetical protein
MRTNFIVIVFIVTTLTSCFRETYNTLQRVNLTGADRYEIKSMAGCCGCKAILYNIIRSNKISEQFVTETHCVLYEPTKHLFTLDTKGRVTNIKSLVAVTDSSFTYPLTEIDREALIKLDSIYLNWQSVNKGQMVFADVTGFREGEKTHMPLDVKVKAALIK